MADSDKRLRYYNGQFLQEQDFTAEQEYHLDRHRRHNKQLHTYGIAEGLTVTADVGATSATVSPGTAIDGEGRPIVLTESRNVPFGNLTGSVLVVISYSEQTSDPATAGDEGDTRWWERPDVEVIAESGAPGADVRIRLARLQIASNAVTQHDTSVRTSAGVRLGTEVSIERIRLSRQGVSQSLWPVLSSGAASQADVTGNLAVSGNILLGSTGTVDGRDVSADGAKLDTLNLSTIAGVSNPGGNIIVSGQNGITISGNNSNKTITIGVGAPASVDGVSNPGGNIDLVPGTNIAITPDNTNKRITIASSTVAGVSNPGGNISFAGQGGILITPDNTNKQITFNTDLTQSGTYLRRAIASASFYQGDIDGATRTVNVGFQPKFIWMQGRVYAYLGGYAYGGSIGGFCRFDDGGSFLAESTGPIVYRYTGSPYVQFYHNLGYGILAYGYFFDYSTTPNTHLYLTLVVDAVTSNGFTIHWTRTTSSGYTTPTYFAMDLFFAALG